jgi:glutathione S-transferase
MTDKIILTIFKPGWHIPNLSPFCMKLETYLRMANIEYEINYSINTNKGPTNKIPYIEHNGNLIGDSGLIIDYLKTTFGEQVDEHLTSNETAQVLAIRRLCEEHLYWIIVYSRWSDPTGWSHFKKAFTKKMPLMHLLVPFIRRKALNQLFQQGIGRLTHHDVFQQGKQDIAALSEILSNKDFMLGDKPSSLDACVYSYIGAIWFAPWKNELTTILCEYQNLLDYYGRMISQYFPELPTEPKSN